MISTGRDSVSPWIALVMAAKRQTNEGRPRTVTKKKVGVATSRAGDFRCRTPVGCAKPGHFVSGQFVGLRMP